MDWDHSPFCNKLQIPKYENFADIEGEITNYNQFKKDLINYLNSHPIIKYSEFKNKAMKFYYKNKCNFLIKNNTFKNFITIGEKITLYLKNILFLNIIKL